MQQLKINYATQHPSAHGGFRLIFFYYFLYCIFLLFFIKTYYINIDNVVFAENICSAIDQNSDEKKYVDSNKVCYTTGSDEINNKLKKIKRTTLLFDIVLTTLLLTFFGTNPILSVTCGVIVSIITEDASDYVEEKATE